MQLKKFYKTLAIITAVSMILPYTQISVHATEEGSSPTDTVIDETPIIETPPVETPIVETPPTEPTPEIIATPTPEATDIPEISDTPTSETNDEPTPSQQPIENLKKATTNTPGPTDAPSTDSNDSERGSNSSLIASQQIVMPPITIDAYRFVTIEKVYAIAKENLVIREEQDANSREVGKLKSGGLCYIIKDINNSKWVYIESGKVRGFLKAEYLTTGKKATEEVNTSSEKNMTLATSTLDPLENKSYAYIKETVYETKAEKVYAIANNDVQILEGATKSVSTRVLGELPKGGICYVLDTKGEWLFVESEDVRGFVKESQLIVGAEAENQLATGSDWTKAQTKELAEHEALLSQATSDLATDELHKRQTEKMLSIANDNTTPLALQALENKIIDLDASITENQKTIAEQAALISEIKAEKNGIFGKNIADAPKVNQLIAPKDNKVFYYTLTSTKEMSVSNSIGNAMIEFASQFLGNPYVWGGTSLTNGTDCSGFVRGIYSQFGYSLPRTSAAQSQVGMKIPVSEARTGDLIFYARDGVIYHVVMYIDNGRVIHASSSTTGIITSGIDTEHAVWATRIISDNDTDKVAAINAKAGLIMYGGAYTNATVADKGKLLGNFKLTAYCNCVVCCGNWTGRATASGTAPVEGRTIAMSGVPFGTKLIIDNKIYTVEDRGTPYGHVNIYMDSHDAYTQFGVQYTDVYAVK